MVDKIEKIKYKTQVIKQIDSFINGGSTTANKKALTTHQEEALSYLTDQGICLLVKPDPEAERYENLDDNDKAGRYRIIEENIFKAHRLRGFFQTEIKTLLGN
jgi:hypothetical protein